MGVGEACGQGPHDLAGPDADLPGQLLGGEVGVVEVVLAAVEEVADLLVRGAGRVGHLVGRVTAVRRSRQPLGQELVATAQVEQDLGDRGHPCGQFAQVGRADPGGGDLAGQRLT